MDSDAFWLALGVTLAACRDPAGFQCMKSTGEGVGARVCAVNRCVGGDCFTRDEAWCGVRNDAYACAPSREECELLAPPCRKRRADEIPHQ